MKKFIREYFKPIDKKIRKANQKYGWDMEDIQIEAFAPIYLAAALDMFVMNVLKPFKSTQNVNADDIFKAFEENEEIRTILIDFFLDEPLAGYTQTGRKSPADVRK